MSILMTDRIINKRQIFEIFRDCLYICNFSNSLKIGFCEVKSLKTADLDLVVHTYTKKEKSHHGNKKNL